MSADDQQFLDLLSSIHTQFRHYSGEAANYVDKAVDEAAGHVREVLATATWLPDDIREKMLRNTPAPPPVEVASLSALERTQNWIVRHKILSGAVVLAVSYVTYRAVRSSKLRRKARRARRARNGGRLEVVVVAGSPSLPLTRALALDLERKGFIVFIVCSSIEDDMMVQNMSRPDIKPLGIDITDPTSAGASIERFAAFLQTPHAAVPRAKPNYLTLKSVLLIPSLSYQSSPIATIPPSSFADLFNTHLLHPILTIQSFLPLLTSRLATPSQQKPHHQPTHQNSTTNEEEDAASSTTPKVLVFTPSIISSINPPFHAPEATICSALSAFTEVLTAELRPLAIPVTHIQLGTFDFGPFTSSASQPTSAHGGPRPMITGSTTTTGAGGHLPPMASHPLQWPEQARHAYARNYAAQSESAISAGRVRGLRGSSLRELHNAVFDVLDGSESGAVVRVGLGAGLYGFVGRYVPRSLVAWMMGIRPVDGELSAWNGKGVKRSKSIGRGAGGFGARKAAAAAAAKAAGSAGGSAGSRGSASGGSGAEDNGSVGSGASDAGSSSSAGHDGGSESGGEHDEMMKEGSEFISVGREEDHPANVWKD